jgi:aspartyl/asparaginyl beta-hydroxylase (cupin superfamily)
VVLCMLSVLEPFSTIKLHHGPFRGVIRLHFGLFVPPLEAGPCFINVDGESRRWEQGKPMLLDDTYPHYVVNDTKYPRVILFCDVNRNIANRWVHRLNEIIINSRIPRWLFDFNAKQETSNHTAISSGKLGQSVVRSALVDQIRQFYF